ncbi:hypothetical protein TYRP_003013 [Tyrophagus putrescentiae]|nr:hypothetical protein TYRP_003013 [Tyrophagus putrescentiae]
MLAKIGIKLRGIHDVAKVENEKLFKLFHADHAQLEGVQEAGRTADGRVDGAHRQRGGEEDDGLEDGGHLEVDRNGVGPLEDDTLQEVDVQREEGDHVGEHHLGDLVAVEEGEELNLKVLGAEEADDVLLEKGHLQQSEIEDDAAGAVYKEEGGFKRGEVSSLGKKSVFERVIAISTTATNDLRLLHRGPNGAHQDLIKAEVVEVVDVDDEGDEGRRAKGNVLVVVPLRIKGRHQHVHRVHPVLGALRQEET